MGMYACDHATTVDVCVGALVVLLDPGFWWHPKISEISFLTFHQRGRRGLASPHESTRSFGAACDALSGARPAASAGRE